MATGISIYSGAHGQARGGEVGLSTGEIVDRNLAGKLAGLDQAPLSMLLGGIGAGAGWAVAKAKNIWTKARAGGATSVADDAAKAGASVADDVVKAGAGVADDAAKAGARGIAGAADDVAAAGAKAGLIRSGANVISKAAVPVALAAEVGLRGYDSYKIEKQHDAVEAASQKGIIDEATMQKVTEERNAGHARNVAGGVGGLAGAWAGFKVGGAIGVTAGALTGPGAFVFSPVLGFAGAVTGAVAGYYAGSKLAEGATDMVTGHDSSYRHTQKALEAVQNGRSVAGPADAGKSWAAAREKTEHQPGTGTPGLSADPVAVQHFSQTFSSSYQTPSGDIVPSVATMGLSRGKAQPHKGQRPAREVSPRGF